MSGSNIKVGIVGGTGYTGVELLRLLAQHPQAELVAITSRKEAGMPVAELFPSLRGKVDLAFTEPSQASLGQCQVVFFATPNAVAMEQAAALLEQGVKVIDLSADFRIKDVPDWERWYKARHASPGLVAEAVYGLPELQREAIRGARLIANPGCYPTSITLALMPAFGIGAGNGDKLRGWCEEKAGLTLGIGLGREPADAYFRVGHMGHVNAQMILAAIATIDAGLKATGIAHGAGAVEAATALIAAEA